MFMALTLLFFALAERYPGAPAALPAADVRVRRTRRADEGAGGSGAARARRSRSIWSSHGELRRIREMMIPLGIVVVAAIVVPWYAALYHRYGWTYITSFFIGENIARYTEGLGVEHAAGPSFYLPVVFSDSFPWSLFLFAARRVGGGERDRGCRRCCGAGSCAIVVFFSFSAGKQDLYIFPIVPAVAGLGGPAMVARLADPGWRLGPPDARDHRRAGRRWWGGRALALRGPRSGLHPRGRSWSARSASRAAWPSWRSRRRGKSRPRCWP